MVDNKPEKTFVKKNATKVKNKEGRGVAEDPVQCLECFFAAYDSFMKDIESWEKEQMDYFVSELNFIEDMDLASLLKCGDVDRVKDELGDMRREDKVTLLEKLISTGSIEFTNDV